MKPLATAAAAAAAAAWTIDGPYLIYRHLDYITYLITKR